MQINPYGNVPQPGNINPGSDPSQKYAQLLSQANATIQQLQELIDAYNKSPTQWGDALSSFAANLNNDPNSPLLQLFNAAPPIPPDDPHTPKYPQASDINNVLNYIQYIQSDAQGGQPITLDLAELQQGWQTVMQDGVPPDSAWQPS
jgi:hypothetical protein